MSTKSLRSAVDRLSIESMSERFGDGHFVGGVLGSRQVSGLTLAETVYKPGLHVPAHAHDHGLCCLVLRGSFTERLGRRSTACGTGSLIYHPADEPHAHDFDSVGGRVFNVQFGAQWAQRLTDFGVRQPGSPVDLHRSRAAWLASQLYHEFCTGDTASVLSIEGLALALLGEVTRSATTEEAPGARPHWLRRAVEYLHGHYRETISLHDLARRVDIDPSHLARTFRGHFGCTMSEYVRKLRVDHARKELLATSKPLSEIAYAAGFSDQAHFSRVFRQHTGLTPGSYRKVATAR
jgi:AraC family transcriptional regulator